MRNLELKNPHMTGGDVGAWQRFLASKGYAPGRVDNDFGQHTHNATIVFQRNHHLYQDGVVGQRTREDGAAIWFYGGTIAAECAVALECTESAATASAGSAAIVRRQRQRAAKQHDLSAATE